MWGGGIYWVEGFIIGWLGGKLTFLLKLPLYSEFTGPFSDISAYLNKDLSVSLSGIEDAASVTEGTWGDTVGYHSPYPLAASQSSTLLCLVVWA